MNVDLRPVLEKDDLFIETVYRSTREQELKLTNWPEQQKKAFIVMQSMAQLADYKSKHPSALFQVIVYKKKDAGRIYTVEDGSGIHLLDITLLPEFRGKGIGTFLLKSLIKKSIIVQKKITLQVDPANPALYLYLKLGFTRTSIAERRYVMERDPAVLL